MLREQSRAGQGLCIIPQQRTGTGGAVNATRDPQSLIYEPCLPPSKRLSFLLTKAAAREGSVWVPPIPPAQLARNIPPQQGPACSSLLPGSPSSTSGSMLRPRRVVQPQGLGRVAPAGIPTDPSHLPASGTLPVQLTTPRLIPSEDET